VFNTVC